MLKKISDSELHDGIYKANKDDEDYDDREQN